MLTNQATTRGTDTAQVSESNSDPLSRASSRNGLTPSFIVNSLRRHTRPECLRNTRGGTEPTWRGTRIAGTALYYRAGGYPADGYVPRSTHRHRTTLAPIHGNVDVIILSVRRMCRIWNTSRYLKCQLQRAPRGTSHDGAGPPSISPRGRFDSIRFN